MEKKEAGEEVDKRCRVQQRLDEENLHNRGRFSS